MTELEFQRLAAQGYTRIPVFAEARADLYTPLALYAQLANGPYSYLLESVVGGERFGRYSFIGLACSERIVATATARGSSVRRIVRDSRGADVCVERLDDADPYAYLRTWLQRHKAAPLPPALRFGGGLVGYFGYETVRHIEPVALGEPKVDPLGTPDMILLVSDELAVVDNVLGKLYMVVYADPREPDAWRVAQERVRKLKARLTAPLPRELVLSELPDEARPAEVERSFTEAGFLETVKRAKEHILAGDVMQVQISQRSSREFTAPPLELYRALRGLNPSP
jgi:anthranilate synthase component 1